mmetsp:Transcript_64464/g.135265  ORF Transcript_64464/g.135265 Transcript_64464/m.135265 type:complete len:269 (-) Transcript_64464:418-1224(-)
MPVAHSRCCRNWHGSEALGSCLHLRHRKRWLCKLRPLPYLSELGYDTLFLLQLFPFSSQCCQVLLFRLPGFLFVFHLLEDRSDFAYGLLESLLLLSLVLDEGSFSSNSFLSALRFRLELLRPHRRCLTIGVGVDLQGALQLSVGLDLFFLTHLFNSLRPEALCELESDRVHLSFSVPHLFLALELPCGSEAGQLLEALGRRVDGLSFVRRKHCRRCAVLLVHILRNLFGNWMGYSLHMLPSSLFGSLRLRLGVGRGPEIEGLFLLAKL